MQLLNNEMQAGVHRQHFFCGFDQVKNNYKTGLSAI
jgi:hypothetical protein